MKKIFNKKKIKILGARSLLVKIHRDLFKIDACMQHDYLFTDIDLTNLEIMVILLEDRRFFKHRGFDLKGAIRETVKYFHQEKHGGGSTIDMQMVRTATNYREREIKRKIYEILLAFLIQFQYSKRTILRSYLEAAFFGSRLIGAESASRSIFGKHAHELSLEEASYVASMLVYPKPLKPSESWHLAIERRSAYGLSLLPLREKYFK